MRRGRKGAMRRLLSSAMAGLIGLTALGGAVPLLAQSGGPAASGFPAAAQAPANAPNVLLILTDDVGFAASSTFGGGIPTPTFDQLAQRGLRYSNFNTAALCSPTRAALLTGRNPHAVGTGQVTDMAVGEPGYTSVIPKSAATIAHVLRANGYSNAWFGKNHNIPSWQDGPLGPFDQWARGLGFDYFYGFHGGWVDQFSPPLYENGQPVSSTSSPDYILDRDLADRATAWLDMQRSQGGGKPFFLYYAPGTAHAPLQAPREWLAKFRGKFDGGWDSYRADVFARQKRMGIVPKSAQLAPMPPGTPAWSTLSADQRTVFARYMEAYAAALAFCDDQIGRIIQNLNDSGELDNTIVIYIQGDNGASAEGGANGSVNYFNHLPGDSDLKWALAHLDEIGGPNTQAIHPVGWASALNTPFPYYKVMASRLGGIRNGMVISWPEKIRERGIRAQFTHVTDVAPTLYELIGIDVPEVINGASQQQFNGVSFAYSLPDAATPEKPRTQYFEVLGHAAVYKDGWFAATPMKSVDGRGYLGPAFGDSWLLYDLRADFTQTRNIADDQPQKLAEMRALFDVEARENNVFPIQSNPFAALMPDKRPNLFLKPKPYRFSAGPWRYGAGKFPSVINGSWSVEAKLTLGDRGGNGTIVSQGDRFAGWGLFIVDGAPLFKYNSDLANGVQLTAPIPLTTGTHDLRVTFAPDGPGFGRGGEFALEINGKQLAKQRIERTVPIGFSFTPATIGHSVGPALLSNYPSPFKFDGQLDEVLITPRPKD